MLGRVKHKAKLSLAGASSTTTVLWLACQKVSTMATVQHSSAYACVSVLAAILRYSARRRQKVRNHHMLERHYLLPKKHQHQSLKRESPVDIRTFPVEAPGPEGQIINIRTSPVEAPLPRSTRKKNIPFRIQNLRRKFLFHMKKRLIRKEIGLLLGHFSTLIIWTDATEHIMLQN